MLPSHKKNQIISLDELSKAFLTDWQILATLQWGILLKGGLFPVSRIATSFLLPFAGVSWLQNSHPHP